METPDTIEAKTLRCQQIYIGDPNSKHWIMMNADADKSVISVMNGKMPLFQINSSETSAYA